MRLKPVSFALIVFILVPLANSQTRLRKTSRAESSNRLRAIEQGLARAYVKGDRAFVERVLADEWKVIDAGGRILEKAEVLKETFEDKERRVEAARIDRLRIRIYGDAAIVTGRSWFKGSYRGQHLTASFHFTDVFVLRDRRWQVVASQATVLQ